MARYKWVLCMIAMIISALNCMLVVSGMRVPFAFAVFDGAVSVVVLAGLSIVQLRLILRATLIPAVFISFLVLVGHMDLFGTAPTIETLTGQSQADPAPRLISTSTDEAAGSGESQRAGSTVKQGASVRFEAAAPDAAWVGKLNDTLDQQIGGAPAKGISIRGSVTSDMTAEPRITMVTWNITFGGETVACGRSSVIGADEDVMITQIARPLTDAVTRTIETARATCI